MYSSHFFCYCRKCEKFPVYGYYNWLLFTHVHSGNTGAQCWATGHILCSGLVDTAYFLKVDKSVLLSDLVSVKGKKCTKDNLSFMKSLYVYIYELWEEWKQFITLVHLRWLWFYTFLYHIQSYKHLFLVSPGTSSQNGGVAGRGEKVYFDEWTMSFPGHMTGIITHLPTSSLPILANVGKVTSPHEITFLGGNILSRAKGRGLEKWPQRQCQGELPTTELGTQPRCRKAVSRKQRND